MQLTTIHASMARTCLNRTHVDAMLAFITQTCLYLYIYIYYMFSTIKACIHQSVYNTIKWTYTCVHTWLQHAFVCSLTCGISRLWISSRWSCRADIEEIIMLAPLVHKKLSWTGTNLHLLLWPLEPYVTRSTCRPEGHRPEQHGTQGSARQKTLDW